MSLLLHVIESGDDLPFRSWSCVPYRLASSESVSLPRVETTIDTVEVFGHWEAECVVQTLLGDWAGGTYLFRFVPVLGVLVWVPPLGWFASAGGIFHPCEIHFVMTLSFG